MKKTIFLAISLFLAANARAQGGSPVYLPPSAISATGQPTAGATVTVCQTSAWSSATNYVAGAVVTYSGNLYLSLRPANLNNTPSPSSVWWFIPPAQSTTPNNCSPAVTVYSDPGLTQAITPPILTNIKGNIPGFVGTGQYVVTVLSQLSTLYNIYPFMVAESGGGGLNPGMIGNLVQYQTSTTGSDSGLAASEIPQLNTPNIFTANTILGGIDPWADVTAFGAIPYSRYDGYSPFTTANCTATSTTISISTALTQNEGLLFMGCGPAVTLGTPVAPTVTPGYTAAGTVPENDQFVNSPTGSSTYLYCVVAIDAHGGITSCGPTTTITNGLALGKQTITITSAARTNDSVTYLTSSPHGLVAGTNVHIENMSITSFDYWGNVANVGDSTHFTVTNTGFDTRSGAAASATGGALAYWPANDVRWTIVPNAVQYAVYGERPGDSAMNLLWTTPFTAIGGFPFFWFEDFGLTLQSHLNNPPLGGFPVWLPLTAPGSSVPGYLSTYCVTGCTAALGSITVANAASSNATATSVYHDDAPNLMLAANSIAFGSPNYAGGSLWIPPNQGGYCFSINSYLTLPAYLSIKGAGGLCVRGTLQLSGGTNWDGSWGNQSYTQFSLSGRESIFCQTRPCIFTTGVSSSNIENLSIKSDSLNGDLLWQSDDPYQMNWKNVAFSVDGGNSDDLIGIAYMGSSTSSGGNPVYFNGVTFGTGTVATPDLTWAPVALWNINRNSDGSLLGNSDDFVYMDNVFLSTRGIEHNNYGGSIGYWHAVNTYRQGGITPLFAFYSHQNSNFGLFNYASAVQDTDVNATVAFWENGGTTSAEIIMDHNTACSQTGQDGASQPQVTGSKPGSNRFTGINCGEPTSNIVDQGSAPMVTSPFETAGSYVTGVEAQTGYSEFLHVTQPWHMYVDMLPPTSLAATVASGGSVPVGTWYYKISSVDFDGAESIATKATLVPAVTTSGNQTVNLTWTNQVGAVSSNISRCQNVTASPCYRVALHQTGTSFSDTAASGTSTSSPAISGAGSAILDSSKSLADAFICPETTAPAGKANFDVLYCDSTAHSMVLIPNNGTPITITSGGGSGTVTSSGTPTAGQFALWTSATNAVGTSTPENIYYADLQAGADCGAKINAANAALSATPGEIWVNQNCGTSTWSNVTLSANRTIRFIQGGTYHIGTIRFATGDVITSAEETGDGVGQVILSYATTSGTALQSANTAATVNAVTFTGFTIDCVGGAGNTAVGLDTSGVSNSNFHGISVIDCGTAHLSNGGLGGSTVYDNFYDMSYAASSASSGFNGIILESSANAQHWYGARFSRLSTQFTIGQSGTATDQVDCFSCTFEGPDTIAIDVVNAFGVTMYAPRFETVPLGVKLEAVASNQILLSDPYWASWTTQYTDLSGTNGFSTAISYVGTPTAGQIPKYLIAGSGGSDVHTVLTTAIATDLIALFSGTCSASTFLRGDGSCQATTDEICSGQINLTTGAISSGTRATNTFSCTGLNTSTDTVSCTFSGDTNAVTGYAPSGTGAVLGLKTWASANTINVDQINNTSLPITPGAATLNCKGIR